jgi:ribosomal protein L6P/L9E
MIKKKVTVTIEEKKMMVGEKKNELTKEEEKNEEETKEEGNFYEIEDKCHNEKEKKNPTSMFGLVQVKWFEFIPK